MKSCFLLFFSLSFIGCAEPVGETISKIPEASGISYCRNSNTLVIANDEGSYYEISPQGKTVQKVKLGKQDLEGVVCEEEEFVFAVENKGLLLANRQTGKKKIVQKVKLGEGAWEGIAFDSKGHVYLADDDGRVVKYTKKALGL